MEKKTVTGRGGASASSLLQIALIVLKLTHVIDWSWWLVLLPTLIGVGILVISLLLLGFLSLFDE